MKRKFFMKKNIYVFTAAVLLSISSSSQTFANCNDEKLADCGSFKILKRTCSITDEAIKTSRDTETYFAMYSALPSGQEKLIEASTSGGQVYHGFVNSKRDVYFAIDSQMGAQGKPELVYSGWQFSFGRMSGAKKCSSVIDGEVFKETK